LVAILLLLILHNQKINTLLDLLTDLLLTKELGTSFLLMKASDEVETSRMAFSFWLCNMKISSNTC